VVARFLAVGFEGTTAGLGRLPVALRPAKEAGDGGEGVMFPARETMLLLIRSVPLYRLQLDLAPAVGFDHGTDPATHHDAPARTQREQDDLDVDPICRT